MIFFTLIGANNLPFSTSCLKSFILNCENFEQLYVFEDGTLSLQQKLDLTNTLRNTIIINKRERDEYIIPILDDFPLIKKFREEVILAQKLVDLILWGQKINLKVLNFIDTDIYFYNKCSLPESNGTQCIFMEDNASGYSFRLPNCFKYLNKVSIYSKINSGLFSVPSHLFQLEDIDSLLIISSFYKDLMWCKVWAEQTIWAVLVSKQPLLFYNKNSVEVASPKTTHSKQTSIIHFVSSFRHLFFEDFYPNNFTQVDAKPHKIKLNWIMFIFSKLKKKIYRYFNLNISIIK